MILTHIKNVVMANLVAAILIITGNLYAGVCMAQEVPMPDYSARPYQLKPDNTLQNLERTDASTDMKVKAAGYGGVEIYYAAFGTSSTVRFLAGSLPRLVIRLAENIDPEESITLSKAEVKKDRRRFLQSSHTMTGATRNTEGTDVKLEFKKLREGLFEILLPRNLVAGEYAFMPMGDQNISLTSVSNIKISCFGIDAATGFAPTTSSPPATQVANTIPVSQPATTGNLSTPTIYPVPDFDNFIYYLSADNAALVDLERAVNSKSEGAFGFLNLNNAVSIKGYSSPVEVAKSKIEFIVRLAPGVDPYTLIELMPCTSNSEKQTRDFTPAAKKDAPVITMVPLKFKRLDNYTYLITPLQQLATGEYFFLNKRLKEKSIFAFRVK